MSLAITEKRNRVAADLANLRTQVESTATHVQQTATSVLGGLDALRQTVDGAEGFTSEDVADIDAAKQLLASTITSLAQQLTALVNPPQE